MKKIAKGIYANIYILISKKNLKKKFRSDVMVVIGLSVKFIENTPPPDLEPS